MLYGIPWQVFSLSLATGLGMTLAIMSVTVAPTAGLYTAQHSILASLPYGLQFFATMGASLPLTQLFGRFGRKPVVLATIIVGILAGVFGFFALQNTSFMTLCLSHISLGIFLAALASLRFASADMVDAVNRSKALALTTFGGVFGAIFGPILTRNAAEWLGFGDRPSVYIMMIFIVVAIGVLIFATPFKISAVHNENSSVPVQEESKSAALFSGTFFLFAAVLGAGSYGIMSGLMTAAGLEMEVVGIAFDLRTSLIQLHVLAMFVPSLFTGWVLNKIGRNRFFSLGLVILLASPVAGLAAPNLWAFLISLILLGLGWNMLYIGGSALIADTFKGPEKLRSQGLYDTAASFASATATLSAAIILILLSWKGLMIMTCMIVLTMLGFTLYSKFGRRGGDVRVMSKHTESEN